jgi:hypothetical protein
VISHILTVESAFPETNILFRSSIPEVRLWWPIRVCLRVPVFTSHTRMLVSSDPLTTWIPSNCNNTKQHVSDWLIFTERNCDIFGASLNPHLEWIHSVSMTAKLMQTLLTLNVPNSDHVIISPRHDYRSVILNTSNSCQVPKKNMETLSCVHVPDTKRCISRSAHHPRIERFLNLK